MGVTGKRHTPTPLRKRKRPDTHCTVGWMDPTGGLDGCGKPRHHRGSIPDRQVASESDDAVYSLHEHTVQ
jgi:hypothetical protein